MRYEEFIAQIRQRARLATKQEALNATKAVLETLAGRLGASGAEHLAAQLPEELAFYLHSTRTGESYDLQEFFHRVSEREGVELADGSFHARVVTGLLSEIVTMGEIADLRACLPPDFARLFEVENEGELPDLT
jgi:uncharacterized protein (DUF2267 family)